ncbi:MAG: AEC family transporter, partial [Rhizobiaceae bacterium]
MSVMFNILAPVMLITAIGYILGRMSIGLQSRTLGNLVILVATPSLVFHTNVTADIGKESLSDLLMAAALCLTISGLIAFMALKLAGSSPQSYLPSLMFPNSGNLGLPLVVLAFGTLGTQMGISYFVVVALIQHSLGLAIASGGFRIGELARQPLVYSVALVLLVMVTGMEVPQVILTTTKMLGDMMIPAMLILLGISLATLKVTDLKVAAALAVARLVIGLISAIAVIKLLD